MGWLAPTSSSCGSIPSAIPTSPALPREARGRAMRATGAEVVKVAVRTERLSDVLPLLELKQAIDGDSSRSVLIGMGPCGLITRVLAARLGSAWTYAGQLKDVGQIDVETLVDQYRFPSITASTDVY